MSFKVGDTVRVRISMPDEAHFKRTGVVLQLLPSGRILVDLGDVQWAYLPDELMKENK